MARGNGVENAMATTMSDMFFRKQVEVLPSDPPDNKRSQEIAEHFRKQEEKNIPLNQADKAEIMEAIAALSRKVDLVFGDAVLVNGRFVDIGGEKLRRGGE